ncbi:ABC transporter substrate-binding protein, partial [Planctomycetota bacterium]|nr:ABC transporter substrate-binding protein [Planctomycetota bacterium]
MKTNLVNGALLVSTLLLSMWAATLPGGARTVVPTQGGAADAPEVGATEVVDARGVPVPVAPYQRIVSLSTISDHALLGLIEPERLVAVTEFTSRHPVAWRFGDRPTVSSSGNLETVLALRPDLVIVTLYADEAYLARLRENGVQVFDLGDMRGIETTRASIRALGALLDVRDRAAALLRSYDRELTALESVVDDSELAPGIYLSVYGDTFFGATANTSYADTLRLGGVRDVAAERGFVDWPQYTTEQLLELDPPLIVTLEGMGAVIRNHALLSTLRACGPKGRIVEIDGAFNGDAGLGIVEAAHQILTRVHPGRFPLSAEDPTTTA